VGQLAVEDQRGLCFLRNAVVVVIANVAALGGPGVHGGATAELGAPIRGGSLLG